ncbi:MAG: polysaccharide biosynthesis C-terminal domain-containing protein [Chitinophagales bacterium]
MFQIKNHFCVGKMNPLKRLASQTFIYGIPSIAGRFLNYLLTYLYTRVFSTSDFGVNSELYAYSGFFAVLLALGLETGFFRFQKDAEKPELVFASAFRFLLCTSVLFLSCILFFSTPIAAAMQYQGLEFYIEWFAWILVLDAIGALPFAMLRAENKAMRFAAIKVVEIGVNVGCNIFFLVVCRKAFLEGGNAWLASCYNPSIGVGYVFISNLLASGVKVLLLLPQMKQVLAGFDAALLKKMLRYSLPMVLIGFAGIVNEMLDRMSLKYLLPGTPHQNLAALGIYGACYKLSVIMNLFIQAFRYAAEPFFFAHAAKSNSRKVYADVLLYFTIFCVFIFLMVMLFIHYFSLFIGNDFRAGLGVVPILLFANMFFGIYTNLSIWYKLTDRTLSGAMVSLAGAVLTVVLLLLLVPKMGYEGAAWATLACYIFMAMVSYFLGQKYFPVPYDVVRVVGYMVLGGAIYFIHKNVGWFTWHPNVAAIGLLLVFVGIVFVLEKKNLQSVRG